MTLAKTITVVALVLAAVTSAKAQQIYKGIVVDSATFAPLPYVAVQLKSVPRGTTTDQKGNFGIAATPNDTLVFSLVGYTRIELPLYDYEAGVILMGERPTLLKAITITDQLYNPYEGLFDEQNAAQAHQKLPFYMTKAKKQKIRLAWLKADNTQAQTYVDLVILNPNTKAGLMKKHALTEAEYYSILTKFNERYFNMMYHLTAAELESFLNRFFDAEAER